MGMPSEKDNFPTMISKINESPQQDNVFTCVWDACDLISFHPSTWLSIKLEVVASLGAGPTTALLFLDFRAVFCTIGALLYVCINFKASNVKQ